MLRLVAAVALLAAAQTVAAEDKPSAPASTDKSERSDRAEIPPPVVAVTRGSGSFGGVRVGYTATAGETYLKDDKGEPKAAIFAVAYVRDGARDPNRPVTFLFNGGPGSGSVWLHMGAFGPKRVASPSDARDDGAPPYPLVDNPDCLLDATDLVFIDPVGTGWSRALGKTEAKDYWGVEADAKSIAQFIRIWLSENNRWNSPKYLGGESYGTTRSAVVAHALQTGYNNVALNGVILISTILDFGAQGEVAGNELQYVVNLPTMATTAAFHGKGLAGTPAPAIAAEARAFATGPYLQALLKGNALPGNERADIRMRLARLTGLSPTFLDNNDLRVTPGRFYKELLRDRRLTIGRLDSRYTGTDADAGGAEPDNDPSFYGIDGAYTAAINAYAREVLKFRPDRQYVTIGGVRDWDWKIDGGEGNFYFNVAPRLAQTLRENVDERVFVAAGWYDFATPFFGAEYALSRAGFAPGRVQFHYYDAGHMMYVHDADRAKLAQDIRAFIRAR